MTPLQKLQELLSELFQLDNTDLDFGIYRIMNLRRDELHRFIDKDLLDAVAKGFEEIKKGESHHILEEISELWIQITQSLGAEALDAGGNVQPSFRNTPLAKQYEEKKTMLADVKVSEELEAELFSDIYTFFSRYWDEGDFISRQRRSRQSKYFIPYNGEEVMLYWANSDQYYIKTGS
jgi:adenine-specific DNA-methyltransferase